jgi:hypothetical protein
MDWLIESLCYLILIFNWTSYDDCEWQCGEDVEGGSDTF